MKGEVIKISDLMSVEATVKLFDKSRWRIINGWAKKFTTLFDKGKPIDIYYEETSVEKIYPNIRLIFDKRNRVIGQRNSTKADLRAIVQENWRNRVKVNNHLKAKKLNAETTRKAYHHLKSLKVID